MSRPGSANQAHATRACLIRVRHVPVPRGTLINQSFPSMQQRQAGPASCMWMRLSAKGHAKERRSNPGATRVSPRMKSVAAQSRSSSFARQPSLLRCRCGTGPRRGAPRRVRAGCESSLSVHSESRESQAPAWIIQCIVTVHPAHKCGAIWFDARPNSLICMAACRGTPLALVWHSYPRGRHVHRRQSPENP